MPPTGLNLVRNGLLRRLIVDYSQNFTRVTYNAVATPQPGDMVVASYGK